MSFVLFDTGPLGAGSLFREPEATIEAWRPDEVARAFEKMEATRSNGKWLAGSASYELGYALISKLAPHMPSERREPLLQFGVFDQPAAAPVVDEEISGALGGFSPMWSLNRYRDAFERIHEHIQSGDIYQANLTFPLFAEIQGCPFALYRALRDKQPVPHGALVNLGNDVLLSRSPELFFACSKSGELKARPMKGTARRGITPIEDERLKKELIRSEKNQAENLMITDLLRNDLGRISEIGSVKVPKLFEVESYATVHQMISEVASQMLPGLTLFDIFQALFPCGSITGAPKIKAMEILSDVEEMPRGSYCGAIGWIAPDGSMEFSVAIRTLICEPSGWATLNVGGGVVFDSTAHDEYAESLLKARFASKLVLQ